MSSDGSVTRWVTALKDGDAAAAQPLWERYHRQLVALARQKLRANRRRAADEEDVVQDAFHSFFRGVEGGRFPQLDDRDNLWRVLAVITARKAFDEIDRGRAAKRGGGDVHGESRLGADAGFDVVAGDEPTPEFAAQVVEEYERLLARLGDDGLRRIAVWKMEGLSNDEIAAKLDCSRRTVARKLDTIRIVWIREATP